MRTVAGNKLYEGQYQVMMKTGSVMGEVVWKSFKSQSNVKMLVQAEETMLKYCAFAKGIIESFLLAYSTDMPPQQSLEHVFVISVVGALTNFAAFSEGRAFLAKQEDVLQLMKKMLLDQECWNIPQARFMKRMVLTFAYNMSLEDPVAYFMLGEEKLINGTLRSLSLNDPTDVVGAAVAIIYRLLSVSVQAGIPSALPEKKQKKTLSRKEIKELGVYTIPQGTVTYADALLLHKMWSEYFKTISNIKNVPYETSDHYNSVVSSLLKADYHGAKIRIVRSKQSSVVGMKGIVVLDTKGTFKIVSKDNKLRTIPKNDSQFEICIQDTVVTIFGKHLNARPAERSVKKTKTFAFPDL
uniref:Ribonuclease P protein subunit p29 n=1 Tax=Anopheles farauti TaxID=69004 RepID=A0A182QYR2_9DIPT